MCRLDFQHHSDLSTLYNTTQMKERSPKNLMCTLKDISWLKMTPNSIMRDQGNAIYTT